MCLSIGAAEGEGGWAGQAIGTSTVAADLGAIDKDGRAAATLVCRRSRGKKTGAVMRSHDMHPSPTIARHCKMRMIGVQAA